MNPRFLSVGVSLGSCALALSLTAPAAASDAESKAAARELAQEGITLARGGKCGDALPKLERAEKLFHAPTILVWIGECQIQLGELVVGTETLNRVVREQLAADAPQAFKDAQTHAQTLLDQTQPRIARLTIEVGPERPADLKVTVSGKDVPDAMLGVARPTNPGSVEIVATAPGYRESRLSLELGEGERTTQSITLERDPNAILASSPETPAAAEPSSAARTWGFVGVVAGGALLAGGGVTGFLALGEKGALSCPNNLCSSSADQETLDRAHLYANLSTALFIAGGVLGATGITLLLLPTSDSGPTALRVGPASVRLTGSF